MGIAPDGALLVRTPSGVLRRVYAGSVRPRDEMLAEPSPTHSLPLGS
ncbi:MAG: hypothetical protein M3409_00375 [Gemmatimonadota bacterium]|nr:hypothetical protein [Gemmatimonadota bacterium]